MQRSAAPTKFPIPFANNAAGGDINPIPTASQIGITPGAASLTDGFPPANFQPIGSGGVAPWGRDMNGLHNQETAWIRFNSCAGGLPLFDATFSTQIGGYPLGAVLSAAAGVTAGSPQGGNHLWLSLQDNNSVNPDTTFDSINANWIPVPAIIDSAVTYTVGGTASQFSDLRIAMEYLSNFVITNNGSVVLQLASGTFTYTFPVLFTHANNDKISILGATMLAAVPVTDASYAINGSSAGQRATDTATNLAMLRTKFATNLAFTNCAGFVIIGKVPIFDAILLSGDGTANNIGIDIKGVSEAPGATTNGVAIVGFGATGLAITGGSLLTNSPIIICGCGTNGAGSFNNPGVSLTQSTLTVGGSILVLGCGNTTLTPPGISVISSSSFAMFTGGSNLCVDCNQTDGIQVSLGSAISIFTGVTTHIYKNGAKGLHHSNGGFGSIQADFGAGGNANTTNQAYAEDMSFININASTNTAAGGGTSPAIGSVGNNNSLIATT